MLQLAAFHARMGHSETVERIISNRLSGQFNRAHVRAALESQAKELPDLRRVIADAVVAMARDCPIIGSGTVEVAEIYEFTM